MRQSDMSSTRLSHDSCSDCSRFSSSPEATCFSSPTLHQHTYISQRNVKGRQATPMKELAMLLSFVHVASADSYTSHQLMGTELGCAGL